MPAWLEGKSKSKSRSTSSPRTKEPERPPAALLTDEDQSAVEERQGVKQKSNSLDSASYDGNVFSHGQTSTETIFSRRTASPSPGLRGHPFPTSPVHSSAFGLCPTSPNRWQDNLRSPPSCFSHSPSSSSRSPKSPWKKGNLLGRGTFGHVYLGFNSESGQMCAVKEVKDISDDANSKECLNQLNQEISLLSQLSHANIVQYYGSELAEDTLSVYLEYVSGGSIHKLLQEYGPFPEPVVRNYTAQILCGLAYLHGRNTVHRDIKGANILVDPNGEIKLADFGMAKHITAYTSMRSLKGSPYWMAPEVIMNNAGYDLSVDIWSLGCTIIEMATSKHPWSQLEAVAAIFKIGNSKDIPELPDYLSPKGKDFLKLCLQRDPSARPSASQLMDHPFVRDQAAIKAAKVNAIKDVAHSITDATHIAKNLSLTRIVGTLGPKSRSVKTIEACLMAGMSVARFDFSWQNAEYHQETLDNLRTAVSKVNKLCAVMLDTVGPELQVCNTSVEPIELIAGNTIVLTPDISKVPSSEVFPINFTDLAKAVKKGDTIFVGQYLFTGSETTSVWLEVLDTVDKDINCLVRNSATLDGSIFTMHVSQVSINMPTLASRDKQVISTWGLQNNIDMISLSYTRHPEDVRELREFLRSQNLPNTQIYAKIQNFEGLEHFDEILQEADGIILSRGYLGIDLPPEKVFVHQKSAVKKCNMAGKPAIITRVVDSMVDNLRPTRAEATDVANAVLDGTDGILLGAETLRGLYPVETIRTVGQICACAEAEIVYNQAHQFKKIVQYVGEPMSHEESVASSAVRAAIRFRAAVLVVFTTTGKAPRLIAKYRPTMPVLAVVFSPEKSESFGTVEARQSQAVRGVYPILAISNADDRNKSDEAGLKLALDYGRSMGFLKPCDRAVIFQKLGDSAVVKIIKCEAS